MSCLVLWGAIITAVIGLAIGAALVALPLRFGGGGT